ncbi:MAG: restriction endonuclease subunit S [Actinomycetota bacterium]|nr:restriction endonuclease subunit S [Actinomycetota bacterium]
MPEDYATYQLFEPDDLVFKLIDLENVRTSRVGLVPKRGIMSSAYLRLRPRPGVCVRFLYWSFFDLYNRQIFNHLGSGVRSTLGAEDVLNLPLPVPPLAIQRAIADYLDTETARIDALIAKKQRLSDLVAERESRAFADALISRGIRWPKSLDDLERAEPEGDYRIIQLSQCLDQLTNGYVGPTRDILVEDGVPYIQSLHIKSGVIDFERRPFFVTPEWHASRPRIHLRKDDVLIVQTGDIGQVAVVPQAFGEASCHALQIARVRPSLVTGPYLAEYLRSSLGYQSLLSRATGALHPHLEGGIRNVPVIVPPLLVQEALVDEIAVRRRQSKLVVERLSRQIELLRERRQALITDAVTGELEVPGVAA